MSDRTFGCPAPSTGVPPLLRPRRALVLVNARSRSGGQTPAVERALAALARAGTACLHEACASSEELAPLIRRHAAEGAVDAVVIGGGDGTLNAAAPALLDTGLPLGILPLGTANDLARTLGLPLDPAAAAQVIAAGRTRRIDLGLVNGHPFFNIASIGLSVAVTGELTAARKRRWGRLAYVVAAVQALARARPFSAVIARDGSPPERVRTVQIAVGNGRYYGGGMAVWEGARIDDGCLDLYSLEVEGLWRLVLMALALRAGRQHRWRGVRTSCGGALEVRTRRPRRVSADGEIVATTPAHFALLPGAVQVFAPAPTGDAAQPDLATGGRGAAT
ncbi:lipid kinase [Roseomonas sp. KE2513]|uniref:lipid kinase n=1 Tax=Roseomonas sp. KE2513 TaxID=2479202 RepID=UPI0018DFE932|nr:lipid kinase [Roseomonas sp. KE2513]MBI0538823.1 lipid kinase [Roseomonas sp. KE2513]